MFGFGFAPTVPFSALRSRKTIYVSPTSSKRAGRKADQSPSRRAVCASTSAYTTVLIIPTGVGAAIGGYAGDALPVVRLVSSIADRVVTHPNVLNGALMYWPMQNVMYVEGYLLDQFAAERCALRALQNTTNKIGLILDRALDENAILRHKQAAEAARATLGLRVTELTLTSRPLGVALASGVSHASWGSISDPASLLEATEELVSRGCDAIAVVGGFPDDEDELLLAEYRAGSGVDAIAGAEAVISHLVTREFAVPCAHAPSLPPLDPDESVSPKAAAEELGYTFLSCVLVGLSRAPKVMLPNREAPSAGDVCANDVDSVIVPADAFGGSALMSLAANTRVLIIAVTENKTALNVPASAVGIDPERVLLASSYAEAAGFVAAHKAGVDIPSLSRHVPRLLSGP